MKIIYIFEEMNPIHNRRGQNEYILEAKRECFYSKKVTKSQFITSVLPYHERNSVLSYFFQS